MTSYLFFSKGTALWGKCETIQMCKSTKVWTHQGRGYFLFMDLQSNVIDPCPSSLTVYIEEGSPLSCLFLGFFLFCNFVLTDMTWLLNVQFRVRSHFWWTIILYCRRQCLRLKWTLIQNSSSTHFTLLDLLPVIRWEPVISVDESLVR